MPASRRELRRRLSPELAQQRGRAKEQQFIQKVQEMLMEEENKRIHIAQGLPWTTGEPGCLLKPPVKERTEPIDLVLHSDVRAVERVKFDQYVSLLQTHFIQYLL
ncbi:microtubule-destabilizing protein 60-like isoform X1 [Phragmites australis]|uniref:microtubule-destabilizing protein 60-like isoform X1 n=1 Tax=Phragmites australis TaxID=29695 RepID=UPI002D77FF82|nr:microtubule-destabilizing protein 60-like isoform X1 [Phragmites australis]